MSQTYKKIVRYVAANPITHDVMRSSDPFFQIQEGNGYENKVTPLYQLKPGQAVFRVTIEEIPTPVSADFLRGLDEAVAFLTRSGWPKHALDLRRYADELKDQQSDE